jgi:hypothetical protein
MKQETQIGTKEFNDLASDYFGGKPKQETLEEVAENFWLNDNSMSDNDRIAYVNGFLTCTKWQQERSYNETEVIHLLDALWDRLDLWYNDDTDKEFGLIKWFNECELKKK